jgi:hypothetical protein
MQLIERKKGSFKSLLFNVDLTGIAKVYTDVSEIYFIIKNNISDLDADAVMTKTMMIDGIKINADSQVSVPWGTTEYVGFTLNKVYHLGLFLKFTGDPVADEDIEQTFTIKITQDFLQDS